MTCWFIVTTFFDKFRWVAVIFLMNTSFFDMHLTYDGHWQAQKLTVGADNHTSSLSPTIMHDKSWWWCPSQIVIGSTFKPDGQSQHPSWSLMLSSSFLACKRIAIFVSAWFHAIKELQNKELLQGSGMQATYPWTSRISKSLQTSDILNQRVNESQASKGLSLKQNNQELHWSTLQQQLQSLFLSV